MTATTWRSGCVEASAGLRLAALLGAALVLGQCSAVPLQNGTAQQPPGNYGQLVSAALKGFKEWQSYTNYQISAPRWVHASIGWSWLACARFLDHGRQRSYAVFMIDGAVALSRYDVRSDRCIEQQYVPFDEMTGNIPSPPPLTAQPQAPGALPPSFTLQQPIY